jgi:hypothetical protein
MRTTSAASIRTGVVAINNRADSVIGLAKSLKGDFDSIMGTVGTAVGRDTVLGHANSIDCAQLINTVGSTTGCTK